MYTKSIMKQKNIFISHIHENDSGLSDLKKLIEKQGMKVRDYSITSDKENNAKAESYIKHQILAPRIAACSAMIVYITPDTKDSKWVNWEIQYAVENDKTVIGVWEQGCQGCDIPGALEEYEGPIVGWQSQKIIDALNGKCVDRTFPDGTPMNGKLQFKRHPC